MKFCVVLACIFAVSVARPLDDEWAAFKRQFDKHYRSLEDDVHRMEIWQRNAEFIEKHNKLNHTFTVAMNQFGDMTDEEFAHYYLNSAFDASNRSESSNLVFLSDESVAAATVDWRTKGYVTPIKNQGACGSCWAFSTTGSLEGQHFKKTGNLVSLSEQNLVDCSKPEGNNGCQGGLMDRAFEYIKKNNGIDTEESYPYKAKNGICHFTAANVGATLTSWVDVEKDSEQALMRAVETVGPVSVAMDASHTSFRFYHQGIYEDPQCSSTRLDHGVLAVGYGNEAVGAYWIVKNSWGTTWGDKGFFKMAKDDHNMCGIATDASYPVV